MQNETAKRVALGTASAAFGVLFTTLVSGWFTLMSSDPKKVSWWLGPAIWLSLLIAAFAFAMLLISALGEQRKEARTSSVRVGIADDLHAIARRLTKAAWEMDFTSNPEWMTKAVNQATKYASEAVVGPEYEKYFYRPLAEQRDKHDLYEAGPSGDKPRMEFLLTAAMLLNDLSWLAERGQVHLSVGRPELPPPLEPTFVPGTGPNVR